MHHDTIRRSNLYKLHGANDYQSLFISQGWKVFLISDLLFLVLTLVWIAVDYSITSVHAILKERLESISFSLWLQEENWKKEQVWKLVQSWFLVSSRVFWRSPPDYDLTKSVLSVCQLQETACPLKTPYLAWEAILIALKVLCIDLIIQVKNQL